jgi:hypothetical protein
LYNRRGRPWKNKYPPQLTGLMAPINIVNVVRRMDAVRKANAEKNEVRLDQSRRAALANKIRKEFPSIPEHLVTIAVASRIQSMGKAARRDFDVLVTIQKLALDKCLDFTALVSRRKAYVILLLAFSTLG